MYRRKQYGQSKIDTCPFCGKQATAHNSQGVPVCSAHRDEEVSNLRCVCGEWLDIKSGKWGPYFQCMNCGNINFRKALEMNPNLGKERTKENKKDSKSTDGKENKKIKDETEQNPKSTNTEHNKKEVVVTSDELDFLY